VTGNEGSVWVVEWAAPPGVPLPPTTAHRSEAGARAAIAAVAEEMGVGAVEEDRPGPMRMVWVGEMAAMMRLLELRA
jgi:hypothetical protein